MKNTIAFLLVIISAELFAQEIPKLELQDMEGVAFETQNFNTNNDTPIVLSFWATWCIPCLNELGAINDNFLDWQKELKFDFYAIATDDNRTVNRVKTLVDGKNWDFKILLDTNQDLKRKLNITTIPYTIIVKNGKIIHKKTGFVKGDEATLYQIIKENQ